MRRHWTLTYADGSSEDIYGYTLRIYEGVLTIEQGNVYHNRQPRSWPMAALRSWEEWS